MPAEHSPLPNRLILPFFNGAPMLADMCMPRRCIELTIARSQALFAMDYLETEKPCDNQRATNGCLPLRHRRRRPALIYRAERWRTGHLPLHGGMACACRIRHRYGPARLYLILHAGTSDNAPSRQAMACIRQALDRLHNLVRQVESRVLQHRCRQPCRPPLQRQPMARTLCLWTSAGQRRPDGVSGQVSNVRGE